MIVCRDCGNTLRFRLIFDATITEYIDGEGNELEDNAGDVNKIDGDEQRQCEFCGSDNTEETEGSVFDLLPRDHPARLDMGGTGDPNDYPDWRR